MTGRRSRVDDILDVIDTGLQQSTEAGMPVTDGCWRCLNEDVPLSPAGLCDPCRTILLSDEPHEMGAESPDYLVYAQPTRRDGVMDALLAYANRAMQEAGGSTVDHHTVITGRPHLPGPLAHSFVNRRGIVVTLRADVEPMRRAIHTTIRGQRGSAIVFDEASGAFDRFAEHWQSPPMSAAPLPWWRHEVEHRLYEFRVGARQTGRAQAQRDFEAVYRQVGGLPELRPIDSTAEHLVRTDSFDVDVAAELGLRFPPAPGPVLHVPRPPGGFRAVDIDQHREWHRPFRYQRR